MGFINSKYPASPSVVKREIDFTSIVRNSVDFTAVYVGAYPWGPACDPTFVFDANDLVSKFGRPQEWNFTHFFAVEDYLAYANPVCLTRVIDDNTFNAYSGNNGTGFVGSAQVINGEIVGITYQNYGTRYIIGDIIPVVTSRDVVTQAVFEVTEVDSDGAIVSLDIIEGGKGYVQDDIITGTTFQVQVKNDDDFLLRTEAGCNGILDGTTSLSALYPSIIAKYPGSYGNSLIFSSARASEFDNWEYAPIFSVPPAADVATYDVVDLNNVINIDAALIADWENDWVVTLNGLTIEEGMDPGSYTLDTVANTLTVNVDTETFNGDDATSEFVLANVFDLPTTNTLVTLNGSVVEQWEGTGVVPAGYVRVNGDTLTFGVSTALASGDGINVDYRLNFGNATIDMNDLQIFVEGNQFNVITTGTPNAGEVLVTTSVVSGNNVADLTFATNEQPANGINNIVGNTGFFGAGDTIEVSYNYPEEGSLKVFANQTEIHAVVVSADGTFATEPGEILEAYSFLSLVPGTKTFDGSLTYYKDVINKQSSYVRMGADLKVFDTKRLTNGTDSLSVGNDELIEGWQTYYSDPDEKQFTYLIGGPADVDLTNWLIDNILECRCDSIGAFSPGFTDVVCISSADKAVENAIAWRNRIRSSSYAVTEGNWKLRYDQYNDVYRWIPLSQDTLGIIAASNQENGVWVSPAGQTRGRYKNYVRMAYNPTRPLRDLLYPNDINPVYNMEGVGSILYGDRTLIGRNSAFREIAVRMLFIKVEYDIAVASRDFLFETNDEFTRRRYFNTVNPYLRNLLGQRAFDDYQLVVDETNNTAEVINNQQMCVNVLIRPNRSINNICLDFTNTRFGLEFEEVLDIQRLEDRF